MSATPPDQPSQEEIDAYMAQVREAPVQDLVLQAFSVLDTGAQIKLGRQDARVLIDCMDVLVKVAGGVLGEVAEQAAEAVGQLKMAQVQVERQLAAQGEGGEGADPQAGAPQAGAPQAGAPQPGGAPAAAPQPGPADKKQTDKLWIPGRDG